MIDWAISPESTTHCTLSSAGVAWYCITGNTIQKWSEHHQEWFISFFSSVDEIRAIGALYAYGEQPEAITTKKQRDALLTALRDVVDSIPEAAVIDSVVNALSMCEERA